MPYLGNGLVLSEGEFWARQRRMANPAFSMAALRVGQRKRRGVEGGVLAKTKTVLVMVVPNYI